MLETIKKYFRRFMFGLFGGMKQAETVVTTTGDDVDVNPATTINVEKHDIRVSNDLLAGKETKAVRELRYRTYLVDRETKKYEYLSPYLAKKREDPKELPNIFDRSDGLDVIVIQENNELIENVADTLSDIGRIGRRKAHWINIARDGHFTPRDRIEDYAKRVVVKAPKDGDGSVAILEFYVSIYPNEEDVKSKGFISEITDLAENPGRRNDIFDIEYVSFVTSNAFGAEDMVEFRFRKPSLQSIHEYKGNYVIRMRAGVMVGGHDIVNDYYEKSMAEKYANKEPRVNGGEVSIADADRSFTCDMCGKTVKYDPDNNLEFFDIQMTKETIGRALCKDCLNKTINDIQEWSKKNTLS